MSQYWHIYALLFVFNDPELQFSNLLCPWGKFKMFCNFNPSYPIFWSLVHKSPFLITLTMEHRMIVIHTMLYHKNLLSLHQELENIICNWKEGDIYHSLCPGGTMKACVVSIINFSGDYLFISPISKLTLSARNITTQTKHLNLKSQPVLNPRAHDVRKVTFTLTHLRNLSQGEMLM